MTAKMDTGGAYWYHRLLGIMIRRRGLTFDGVGGVAGITGLLLDVTAKSAPACACQKAASYTTFSISAESLG